MSEHEEDFAAMFEASEKARRFERGQTVDGIVVAIGPEVAFVSLGAKSDAEIDLAELKNTDGAIEVAIGDRIRAKIVSTSGGIVLSRKGVRNAATQRELEEAFSAGIAVEGKVDKVVKGGYEVRIARERAFCPLSQIDSVRTADPAVHVGKTYSFRITEYGEGGQTLVVSRRKQLEEEQRASADALRQSIVPGAVLSGRVASVFDYGAFVELGAGVQGLLHVSDMSWSRVPSAHAVTAVGDEITVKVLRVDEATDKISLGSKQLLDDPWSTAAARFEVGQVRTGRVTRIAEFGAFVELEPGIEGLVHASTFPPTGRRRGWADVVPPGTAAAFEIVSIDIPRKRIGLVLVEEGSSRSAVANSTGRDLVAGVIVTGKVERYETFGVFVFLSPGRTGLIPRAETGLDRDSDMAKAFPIGSDVEVAVLEVDPEGRRIRLSRTAVARLREQAEVSDFTSRPDAQSKGALGSLGDKLRDALQKR